MAYGLIIAAVRPEKFSDFKAQLRGPSSNKNPLPFLDAEKIVITTHYYFSAGTGDSALDATLTELFESGEKIDNIYWHPYRPPLYQDNDFIRSKIPAFKRAYDDLLSKIPKDEVQYWNMDFSPMLNIADFAYQNNFSLLTFLEKPMDEERANKVHYPIYVETDQKLNFEPPTTA